ncbi:MAG: hypothetical protein R2827_09885 [Bdellovibrionales bacterium]
MNCLLSFLFTSLAIGLNVWAQPAAKVNVLDSLDLASPPTLQVCRNSGMPFDDYDANCERGGGGGDWGDDAFQSTMREGAAFLKTHIENIDFDQLIKAHVGGASASQFLNYYSLHPERFEAGQNLLLEELDRMSLVIADSACGDSLPGLHSWICTKDDVGAVIYVSPKKFAQFQAHLSGINSVNLNPSKPSLLQAARSILHEILHHLAPIYMSTYRTELYLFGEEEFTNRIENAVQSDTWILARDLHNSYIESFAPVAPGIYRPTSSDVCYKETQISFDYESSSSKAVLSIKGPISDDLNIQKGLVCTTLKNMGHFDETLNTLELKFNCDSLNSCQLISESEEPYEIQLGFVNKSVVMTVPSILNMFGREYIEFRPMLIEQEDNSYGHFRP